MSDYEYMEIPKDLYDSLEIIAKENSMPANKLFEKLLEIQHLVLSCYDFRHEKTITRKNSRVMKKLGVIL